MYEEYITEILPSSDKSAVIKAAKILRDGGLVAIPTETVYGLAAHALNEDAVEKIFTAKGRPQDNPLIVHISDMDMWKTLVTEINEAAKILGERFWPGPLTIILPKSKIVPLKTTGGLDTVAVRMPNQKDILGLIKMTGIPLAAPSANLSGLPSPTTAQHCMKDLKGKIPLILDGGACSVGIESTVVSLIGEPTLLRPGKITAEELSLALGKEVKISAAVTKALPAGEKVSSPGMKYKHYSPLAKVILFEGNEENFFKELNSSQEGTFGLIFEGEEALAHRPFVVYGREHDAASQARGIFSALRLLDEKGASVVYARSPEKDNEALGVYNRMLRAAAFRIKKV